MARAPASGYIRGMSARFFIRSTMAHVWPGNSEIGDMKILGGIMLLVAMTKSAVPEWDARGLGPLPRQGISCLDVGGDGAWIAVGTIAPPGDPNVFLFDGNGQLVRTAQVGQRWIQQVAVDRSGKLLHALCTMPEGRAGDRGSLERDRRRSCRPSDDR